MSRGQEFFNAMIRNEPERSLGIMGIWDWMVDHPGEVLDAYVAVGALNRSEDMLRRWPPSYSLVEPPKLVCGAEHPSLFTCVDTLRRGSLATPLTCTEPRDHGAFWHTAQNGTVRWEP